MRKLLFVFVAALLAALTVVGCGKRGREAEAAAAAAATRAA